MYPDQPIEPGEYFWFAMMGPKGQANLGDPHKITVKVIAGILVGVFDTKFMGSFQMTGESGAVMWNRMEKSPRAARELALRLLEVTDPESVKRIREKDHASDLWKDANTPTINESLLQPAWSIEE